MICPKCKSRVETLDVAIDRDAVEVYRKHRCEKCNISFSTAEFIVEENKQFKKLWHRLRVKQPKKHVKPGDTYNGEKHIMVNLK